MFDLAIYYRTLGGFAGLANSGLTRARFAIVMGSYMALLSLVHHEGMAQGLIVLLLSALGAFLGRLVPHAKYQASASLQNSLAMALITGVRLLLILIPYSIGNWLSFSDFHFERLLLALFGAGAGVAYYVGWKYLDGRDCGIYYRSSSAQWRISAYGLTTLGMTAPTPTQCLDQAAVTGGEWGELLTGFLTYELMFIVALVAP